MKKICALILLVIVTIAAVCPARAEDADRFRLTESGPLLGYGQARLDTGHYRVMLFIWHFAADLKPFFESLQTHKGQLSIVVEPQVNYVFDPNENFEAGVGFGLQYAYPVWEKVRPFVIGMGGPHYISAKTDDTGQARGFCFVTLLGGGLQFDLGGQYTLELSYRYRHISNANTNPPNGSINNHMGMIGVYKEF